MITHYQSQPTKAGKPGKITPIVEMVPEHLTAAIAAIERKGGTVINHPTLALLHAERARRAKT